MTKTCPSCDILAPPDARYCRHCGTQLKRLGAADAGVSPIAATVPLSAQNTTDEIVAHPAVSAQTPAAAHTSEVTHEEMHELFAGSRSANAATAPDDYDDETQITIPVRPLTSRNLPADAAAAAASASGFATRAANGGGNNNNRHPQFNSTPQQVTLSPTGSLQTRPDAQTAMPSSAPAQATERRAFRIWLGAGLALLSLLVIVGGMAVAVFWFNARGQREQPAAPAAAAASGESAPVVNDPKQLAAAKLSEADALVAAGRTQEALSRLREAAVYDPSNAETQRKLARLLLDSGARREAIEALRALVRLAPEDSDAWRRLASAQFAEGQYAEAVESYRGLGSAAPAALARDSVQLAYADALRLAGQTNEARVIYRRLAQSSNAQVAAASREQLGLPTPDEAADEEAGEASEQAAATAREGGAARGNETARGPETSSAPPPAPTPAAAATGAATNAPVRVVPASSSEHYQRGIGLWGSNRAAAVAEFRAAAERGNSEANYYLGLSIAEGRDPRALKRAELVAAIVHFGRARKGKFRAQSVAYEEQLGRELDRRRSR